jgi:streptogramin lyase
MQAVGRPIALAALAVAALVGIYSAFGHAGSVAAQAGGELEGLGTLTGTVTAAKPFKAARVFLHSLDRPRRNMLYMVYTQAGAFKAVAVMPGNYELFVKERGLESDPQPITIKPGMNQAPKVTMHDSKVPNAYPTIVDPSEARTANGVLPPQKDVQMATYEEVFPPGPGRVVLETLCMRCHGENFFAMNPRSAQGWQFGIETRMMGKALFDRMEKTSLGEGILAGSASNFRFGAQDRKDVLEYLSKNLGLDKKPRAIKTDPEMPLDETQLGKAQYIEYYVTTPENEKASSVRSVAADNSENAAGGVAGYRLIMQVTIDAQGNRWAIDRGVPSRLVKLDPRTGEQKVFLLPDKRAGVHDMTQDRQGMLWVLEFGRNADGSVEALGSGSELTSRIIGFNPKTEKWEHQADPDPDNVIRATHKGPLMGGLVDSKGQVWAHWMQTGAISKYDPKTGKAETFRIPTPNAVPYGACVDPFDNIWVAEWSGGKLARFDQSTGAWTEFVPPMYPANFRRGPESDADGNIWVGVWSAGNRPGMIAKLDQKTGKWTTYEAPFRGSQPYETSIDRDGNVWFPDISEARPDRGTAIGRLDLRTRTFTYYPRPQQVADSTRVMHAEDGSVHYTARYGSSKDWSGIGVLFPDKDKITTLAPRMLNGGPGYGFKVAAANPGR